MQETKDPKSSESAEAGESVESRDPRSDATSSETLSDVEESAKAGETDKAGTDDGEEASAVPSPDGAFDEGRGGSNGLEDAGPM